jgi:hypothetical protein
MPVLVLSVAEDLDKLLEDSRLAAIAPLGKLGRVVVVTVDMSIVFVVAVLGAKDGGTEGAGEMINMILVVEGGYV